MDIKVKLLCRTAAMPTKAHPSDAGWDLRTTQSWTIHPGQQCQIKLGVALEIPDGWFVQLAERSSLAARGIHLGAGVIDPGYRGELIAVLRNDSAEPVTLNAGDKVCQALILPIPEVQFVDSAKLEASARGSGGFGSTGAA